MKEERTQKHGVTSRKNWKVLIIIKDTFVNNTLAGSTFFLLVVQKLASTSRIIHHVLLLAGNVRALLLKYELVLYSSR